MGMNGPTEDELTDLHLYVEDLLVSMRDSHMSELHDAGEARYNTPANGLVVRERDGSPSDIIRIGTRFACKMIIERFLELRSAP